MNASGNQIRLLFSAALLLVAFTPFQSTAPRESLSVASSAPEGGLVAPYLAKVSSSAGGFTGSLDVFDRFGISLAYLGDLNGDGVGDLAVGADGDDDGDDDPNLGGRFWGAVWILFMNPDGSVESHQKISQTAGNFGGVIRLNDQFGRSIAALGDLDGDGTPDLAVSGLHDEGATDRSAVWILFLNPNGTVSNHEKLVDIADTDELFGAMSAPGDLNGDGSPDLVVGAAGSDDGGTDTGALYVVFLNDDGTLKGKQKISATAGGFTGAIAAEDQFGTCVASLGDLDGDGVADLVASAPRDDDGGNNAGAVWVLFMNGDGTVKAHQKISPTEGGFGGALSGANFFGSSCAGIGDDDGDDVFDLVVGAAVDRDSGQPRGAVWFISLNVDGTVKSERKLSSTQGDFAIMLDEGDEFGISVASIGDLNGDGRTDLAVGAIHDDDGGNDLGAVWLLLRPPWAWGDADGDGIISEADARTCLGDVVDRASAPLNPGLVACDVAPTLTVPTPVFGGVITAVDAQAILAYARGMPVPDGFRVGILP